MLPGWPNRNNKRGEEEVRGQEQKEEQDYRERLKRGF